MDGLARRYVEVRRQTDRLAEPLSAEDCQAQSMPDASPTKWHLAHTAWFFETFVLEGPPVAASFDYLFNSYYEAVGPRHPRAARGLLTRPSLDEVRRYRQQVDERVLDRIERGVRDDVRARIVLGLHHEQQHQELILTDIKHLLGGHPHWPPVPPSCAGHERAARRRGRARAGPRVDRASGRRRRDRRRDARRQRRAVRVRQREPEAPGAAAPLRDRVAPGDVRRVPRVHE